MFRRRVTSGLQKADPAYADSRYTSSAGLLQEQVAATFFSRYGFLLLLAGGSLFIGCTSLPDTSGYTAATIQVKQAVATSGEVVKGELESAIRAGATTADEQTVNKLETAWAATVRSLDAMVAHAQSIEQIVAAGNKGAESARQVADSVKTLADAVKVDAVTGAGVEVVKLATDTVAFVYGEYSKHVAAKSLQEALDRFAPSMAKITTLVQAQVADARRLFVEQIEAQVLELSSGASGYGDWLKRTKELGEMRHLAIQRLLQLIPPVSANVRASLEQAAQNAAGTNWMAMTPAMKVAKVDEHRSDLVNELQTSLTQMELANEQIAPYAAEYNAKILTIRQREKAGRSILSAAENAIAAWGVAHQQLVQAVKERKPVSVESLTAAVVEVRTLISRWHEL